VIGGSRRQLEAKWRRRTNLENRQESVHHSDARPFSDIPRRDIAYFQIPSLECGRDIDWPLRKRCEAAE
jgi:hypothetical protein